ncbi:MAG: hypothetical protein HY445_03470 [Candidatus Niyogibacteria bacterium]|nr:hypothetical protein [Candidatus Niyogibacteria bacterium]
MDNTSPLYPPEPEGSVSAQKEEQQEQPQKKEEGREQKRERGALSRIRTFRADAEEYVKEKGVTLGSLAQERHRIVLSPLPRKGKHLRLIFFIFVAALVAGTGAYFFLRTNGMPQTFVPETPQTFYPIFDERVIMVRNSPSDFIPEWQGILLRSVPQEQMLGVFTQNESTKAFLSAEQWFPFVGIDAPAALRATFRVPWTLGVLGTSGGIAPVWMIPVASFSRALAGMLVWEADLPYAMRNVLPPGLGSRQFDFFKDRVIANQDARFLQNTQGELLFTYVFFDRRILIMTTSFEALEIILSRFLIDPPR